MNDESASNFITRTLFIMTYDKPTVHRVSSVPNPLPYCDRISIDY